MITARSILIARKRSGYRHNYRTKYAKQSAAEFAEWINRPVTQSLLAEYELGGMIDKIIDVTVIRYNDCVTPWDHGKLPPKVVAPTCKNREPRVCSVFVVEQDKGYKLVEILGLDIFDTPPCNLELLPGKYGGWEIVK